MLHAMPESSALPDAMPVDAAGLGLLNAYQRDFPLVTRPFAQIARQLDITEREVMDRLARWMADGTVSRVGPVFSPRRVGASTLAALKAPPGQLAAMADLVSAHAEVNHNYAREHAWNLWFVLTAPDADALARVLGQIRRDTGCPVMALPLRSEYHIDLGFDLVRGHRAASTRALGPVAPAVFSPAQTALTGVLQSGLPLVSRPFASVARRLDRREGEVIAQVRDWLGAGIIKRFGVVVRHHELGYRVNAMCVWNVPDAQVDDVGIRLASAEGVNLCYRRDRAGADWPFNLYCMIHGRDRDGVHARIEQIRGDCGLHDYPAEVLFSTRRFKQCGARYVREVAHG
jgi:DNA-binding Lrp family transcriptional regulator